jgi:hypothetical protein
MKIEYEQKATSVPVYVADDGTKHTYRSQAIQHDAAYWRLHKFREITRDGIFDTVQDIYVYLYKITCQEDWDYLNYVEWGQNTWGVKYTTPGWYGAIRHDGGDYADDYEIFRIDEYVKSYEEFLTELKHLTSK